MDKSSRIVTAAMLATLGSTLAASFMPEKYCGRGELPSPRLLFGTALTFAGLSMLADFAPKIASGLAASLAITSLGYYGLPVLDAVFTDTPCKPVNNGKNGNNGTTTTSATLPLPDTGAGTGGDFGPLPGQAGNVPQSGNQAARPTF